MSEIKLVLFDVGIVILRSTHQITFAILWDLGVRPDKVALFFHQKAYGEFARGKITGNEFAEATRNVLEAPWLTDEQIHVAHDVHIYMVDQAVVAVLEGIQARKVPLAFVTTTNKWQTERENQFIDLVQSFGPVVRSHLIGMSKTDEGAWPVILNELSVDPARVSETLLVDDSSKNCIKAQQAGLQTHLYEPTPQEGVRKLRQALKTSGALR